MGIGQKIEINGMTGVVESIHPDGSSVVIVNDIGVRIRTPITAAWRSDHENGKMEKPTEPERETAGKREDNINPNKIEKTRWFERTKRPEISDESDDEIESSENDEIETESVDGEEE